LFPTVFFLHTKIVSITFLITGSKQELAKIKTKIELEKKENEEELAKTRADFSKSVSELSTDLNGISLLF
jgi:hypothetical protein